MDNWLKEYLVCPQDHNSLHIENNTLRCPTGHTYFIVDNIPVMLFEGIKETQAECSNSLARVRTARTTTELNKKEEFVDPFVQQAISATSGIMWISLINKLKKYPIPKLPLPATSDKYFLDIGCNWGRWSIAAARLGYRTIGLDYEPK